MSTCSSERRQKKSEFHKKKFKMHAPFIKQFTSSNSRCGLDNSVLSFLVIIDCGYNHKRLFSSYNHKRLIFYVITGDH